jgi:predicted membrane chloride channel (bestrophin family)
MRERPVSRITSEISFRPLHLCPLAALLNSLLSLTDSLTGLERILTTPIPFSYSIHLWAVTAFYCLALPFQIVNTMHWITIPGTTVVVRNIASIYIAPPTVRLQAFVFFGFLVAGEEIESKSHTVLLFFTTLTFCLPQTPLATIRTISTWTTSLT